MNYIVKDIASKFLQTGYDELSEREKRVLRRIAKRMVISENVNEQFHEELTFGQRLADQVAAFGGSWSFILLFGASLVAWVLLNSLVLPNRDIFDPYPFIFLNLILSMLAAVQAPVIMMSQNRQTSKDRMSQANDYQINLKAELEIMNLHEKIDNLRIRDMETLLEQQTEQIRVIQDLIRNIDKHSGAAPIIGNRPEADG